MNILKKLPLVSEGFNLIQLVNSFQSSINSINKVFVQRIYDQRAIWSPINEDYCQYYLIQKEGSATDDYWTSGYDWGLVPYRRVVLPDSETGVYAGAAAGYTLTIGATQTITFNGTGLEWFSYTSNSGGKWQYVLDGGAPVEFSVYSAVAGYLKQTLFTGLAYGSHTVVCTFLGADTNTVGGPYGWTARATNTTDYGTFAKCFHIIGSDTPNCGVPVTIGGHALTTAIKFSSDESGHKEMSFSVLAASGTTAVVNNWIPNHSASSKAAVFATLATDRTLKIDGAGSDLLTSITDIVSVATGGTYVDLRQVYKGVNKDDTAKYLWDVIDITRWSKTGIKFIQDWNSLTAHASSTAYCTMFGVNSGFTHVISNGVEIDITATVSDQIIANNAAMPAWKGTALAVNKTGTDLLKSYAFAYRLSNPISSMNLSSNYGQRLTWSKSGVLRKLYPTIFLGNALPASVRFYWECEMTMGFVSDAYNKLIYHL